MDYGVTTLDINDAFKPAAGMFLTCALLIMGHWAPWKMGRLWAYVYGCVSILAGFAVWHAPDWMTVLGLAVIIGAGGTVTLMLYALDDYREAKRQAREAGMLIDHASK